MEYKTTLLYSKDFKLSLPLLNINFYANVPPQGPPLKRVDSHLYQLKHLWSPMGWSRVLHLEWLPDVAQ